MVFISRLSCEHYESPLGIHHIRPRLSWRFEGSEVDWKQASYDLEIRYRGTGNGDEEEEVERHHVDSLQSVLVPWPGRKLVSRDVVHVRVRSNGEDGSSTDWTEITLQVALLSPSDWTARLLGGLAGDVDAAHRPILLRKAFPVDRSDSARLYITAHGCYKVFINGHRVGDQALAPGWQSYHHRLHYQTYDVSKLLKKGEENVIGVVLGEGWFATRLNFGGGRRNIWGADLGVLAQLEIGVCSPTPFLRIIRTLQDEQFIVTSF
jgi:alpha-L-rhamnosidase